MRSRPTWVPNSAPHLGSISGWRYSGILVWLAAAVLAYRFYWVVLRYAVNLFFFDEWDVYDGLFRGWPWWRFFWQQHGPHRQGLGVTLVIYLLKATEWDSRMQAYANATAIVLAMVLAIRLKVKVFGSLEIFDVVIPILFLGLGQWEVLLSAPGPSAQAFPLLLLIAYCLAWAQDRGWVRYGSIIGLNFLLLYTGYGMFAGLITLALLALDCWQNWSRGTSLIGPCVAWMASAASLASFFYGYVFSAAAGCYRFPYRNPAAYFWFMGLMFAKYLGIKHGQVFPAFVGIGVVILLVTVLARTFPLVLGADKGARVVTVILTAYTLLYAAAAAIGRICLGMQAAGSSRNLTLLIPGFLGIYFYLLTLDHSSRRTLLMSVLVIAVFPACIQRNHKEIEGFSAMKHAWKNCYRTEENVEYCDAFSRLELYSQPEATHLRAKLAFLKQNRLNLYANNH